MNRTVFSTFSLIFMILLQTLAVKAQQPEKLAPGIWKLTFGTPE
jgi:hypothetical protein